MTNRLGIEDIDDEHLFSFLHESTRWRATRISCVYSEYIYSFGRLRCDLSGVAFRDGRAYMLV